MRCLNAKIESVWFERMCFEADGVLSFDRCRNLSFSVPVGQKFSQVILSNDI